ncbi:hypothetical protein PR048_026489 [Dryococelus australis]|uniref:Uncharacterized protein n=1 Tax=Dryococelus australis TaxID=614101 RepID=A0ABQ9GLI9_9NEOP|nr:hypothetical protein PR048_026489 [Dryococelus australis]
MYDGAPGSVPRGRDRNRCSTGQHLARRCESVDITEMAILNKLVSWNIAGDVRTEEWGLHPQRVSTENLPATTGYWSREGMESLPANTSDSNPKGTKCDDHTTNGKESSWPHWHPVEEGGRLRINQRGDKSKLKAFIDNAEAVIELTDPLNDNLLLKFVKAKISQEAKTKLLARTAIDSMEGVQEFKRMFGALQVKDDNVAEWGSRIDTMMSDLKDAAAWILTRKEIRSAQALIDHLAKVCFEQRVSKWNSPTGSKKQKKRATWCPSQKNCGGGSNCMNIGKVRVGNDRITCGNCNKIGHRTENFFLEREIKTEREVQLGRVCYWREQGHIKRNCHTGEKRDVNTMQPDETRELDAVTVSRN